jgi:2-hydroxy-3-keto-5-methylthiopentenyl-1-phosphate phosphatase
VIGVASLPDTALAVTRHRGDGLTADQSRFVFCDFDGTISAGESFADMMRREAPSLANDMLAEIYALRVPLRVGVRRVLESIPSGRYPAIVDSMRGYPLRAGLAELIDFLDRQGVPFVVVSGGLEDMVRVAMGPLADRCHAIVAQTMDTSGPQLKPLSAFEGETEMVDKVRVMAHFTGPSPAERVAIGDSVTDINMAQVAELTFARDRLARYLTERNAPFVPWDDFFDVRRALEARWG